MNRLLIELLPRGVITQLRNYAKLMRIDKPIGISTYHLTRALPRDLQSALPTVEEIEAELAKTLKRPEWRNSSVLKPKKTTASRSRKK